MSSFVQNKKELKSPLNLSPYVKVNSSSLENAAADKDPPRRTIVSLKELIVDDGGLEDNKGVVVANAAVAAGAASNDRTKCTAPISGDGSVRCKSATENGAKCGTGAALLTPPSQESVNKTMPSPIDDSTSPSVASNNTQSDSNDSGDDLCAQATANTIAADVNNDTNNGENAKQKKGSEADAAGAAHDPAAFRLHCECDDCLEYREMLIQLMVEDHEYNVLWDRLKALIREFYDVVPQNPKPYEGSMDEKYESMMQKHARWFSDGHIDNQKNIQLSLSSHLPLSNEMTFVLVFSMLYTRDPHQLFELLCIQLRCIAVAYSDGLKKLITTDADGKNPKYNPIQLLDVILDGYDKFCSTATKLSSLLFEIQRDQRLTWNLLNKRMYQRWVYFEVQDLIPECILMLKDLLDSEDYSAMAHRLIRFDEEMTSITQSWIEVWSYLQNYYLEGEECERRTRILHLEEMMKSIRANDFSRYGEVKATIPMAQWGKLDNRKEAWLQMIDYLKKAWNEKDDSRLAVKVLNDNCVKCEFELASHYIDCECLTCSLAGGPNQRRDTNDTRVTDTRCAKCVFYEQLDLDYLSYVKRDLSRALDEPFPGHEVSEDDSDNDNEIDDIWKTNHSYHLAWAVFKHLPDRKAYSALKFDPRHFCMFQDPPCPRTECRVATHIIAGLFPLNFCKFLIKAYHPLYEEERKELMNIKNLYFTYLMQKFYGDNMKTFDPMLHMHLLSNLDDTDYSLFCGVGSAFAECYLIEAPIPVQEILYSCFIVENNDIELNMYWLECIYMFRTNENSPLKKIENDPKVMELQLRMQMDQIGQVGYPLKAELSQGESNFLSVLKWTPDTKHMPAGIAEALGLADCSKRRDIVLEKRRSDEDESGWRTLRDTLSSEPPKTAEEKLKNDAECDYLLGYLRSSRSSTAKPKTTATASVSDVLRSAKGRNATASTNAAATAAAAAPATKNDKDEPLTDAVKIAVKQKLNQKLEAELKVLKKEHSSVLKEMVRDLEQIKENGENQLIAKKEKCSSHANANANGQHCCSDHSDMMDNHANHTKICHRGDGQCTCYYCTIFGHAECNHGRMNETRDRLRKRLHQIHSKSSTKSHNTKNIKSQPGINLKKLLATASNGNGNASGGTANSAKTISKSVAEQKENNANETLEEALKTKSNAGAAGQRVTADSSKSGQNVVKQQRTTPAATSTAPATTASDSAAAASTTNSATNATADTKNTIKKRKLLNVNQHYQNLYECDYGLCSSCDEHRQKVKPARTVPPTQSARTHGISPSKLPEETLASVRRASFCPIIPPETASLDDILDFIEGNTTSKKDSQKKAAKKAKQKQKKEDVKKIEELEQLRTEFHDNYFKEFEAKNDLKALKSVKKRDKKRIAEMEGTVKKFGKFKAKVESGILELIAGLKKNNAEFKFAYLPTKEQQLEWQRQQEEEQRSSPPVAQMQSIGSTAEVTTVTSATCDGDVQQPHGENVSSSDPSKRMVTIRRINLPHSEPQVTVTAKGTSPDKDKLLYTFINGQLIPGATPASGGTAATAAPSKPDKKSKSDGKQPPQVVETTAKGKNSKKANQPIPPVPTKPVGKEKAKTNGKQSPDVSERVAPSKADAAKKGVTAPVTSVTDKKKQKPKKNSVDEDIETITAATKEMALAASEEKPKKEKRKVRAMKFEYADPNYKVNQFDLLDMDEDDEYYTESSSSSDEEEPPKPAPVITTKVVQQQQHPPPHALNRKQAAPPPKQKQQPQQPPPQVSNDGKNQISNGSGGKPQQPQPQPGSKKQKKKLAQQQQLENEKSSTKSLASQMQRLQLNADTTIELVNDQHRTSHGQIPPNVSIMDQLNRGVKVEGLMLPPGITLTRVDPNTAEGLRAKKESIGRLSQPAPQQYQQPTEYHRPPPPFLNANVPMMPSQMPQQSNGFIMVDPMQKHSLPTSLNGDASKKSKTKKKKNKKAGDAAPDATANQKIVTLRNPLFQQAAGPPPGLKASPADMAGQMPWQRKQQIPAANVNQHASIIKNENGMFTIRNPALHQQLTNTVNTQYRPYASELYPHEVKPDNFSYFSENVNPMATGRLPTAPSYAQPIPMPPSSNPLHQHQQQKSTQAIGSEIKSAHQIKNVPWYPVNQQQQQQSKQPSPMTSSQNGDIFNNLSHLNPQRSYSPFDASTNYGFNSDFIGASPTPHTASSATPTTATVAGGSAQNQYYNGVFNSYNTNATDSDSLFSSSGGGGGGSAGTCNGFYKGFDDHSFLNNLHPGQRLNSEVTVHNIGDAKFGRDQAAASLNDGVEITRVNGPMPGNGVGYSISANRAVGSHRQPLAEPKSDLTASSSTEFGDSVFVPNQSVNLSELESEERDIESFKRFNYYFEPPKNKPKINFNVKDIVVTKKQPASDNSSPYFGDLASSSLCNTPPPHPDEEYHVHASSVSLPSSSHDLCSPKPNHCDPLKGNAPTANLDNFLHGIIGDEVKVDRV